MLAEVVIKSNQGLMAYLPYRPFNKAAVGLHQRNGLILVKVLLIAVAEFAPGGAAAVDQGLPATLLTPGVKLLGAGRCLLEVDKLMLDAVLIQP